MWNFIKKVPSVLKWCLRVKFYRRGYALLCFVWFCTISCIASSLKKGTQTGIAFQGDLNFKSEQIERSSLRGKRGIEAHTLLVAKNEKQGIYFETQTFLPLQYKNLFADRWMLGGGYLKKLTPFFTWDIGMQYHFLRRIPSSQPGHWREIYTGIKADLLLTPSFYVYHDFEHRQWCLELKFTNAFDLSLFNWENWSLELQVIFGYIRHKKPFCGVRSKLWERKNHYFYTELDLALVYHFHENLCVKIGPHFSYNRDGTKPYSIANEATHHSHLCSLNFGISCNY